jgi:AraC-like DNA-binding protein
MYSNLAFALILLGIFSILENFRTNYKFSVLRYHMIAILVCITISSLMDYLDLNGFLIPYYKEVTKFLGTGLIVNLFYVLVLKKIPRIIIIIEIILIFLFIIMFCFGFQFPLVINNQLQNPQSNYHKVFYIFCLLFTVGSILFNMFKLFTNRNNNNLYEIKIKKWVGALFIAFFILILINVLFLYLFLKGLNEFHDRTYITLFTKRFYMIIFILYRPKFLDDDKLSIHFNEILVKPKTLAFKDFEFLFYSNHYYLRQNANMEDLALKLNVSKNDLAYFLKNVIEENLTDLLNKNRVDYLKELLKAKKYESFTIEALSEMAGFNTRRTMQAESKTTLRYVRAIRSF